MAGEIVPQGYVKKLLGNDERILLIAHQHWFVIFSQVFLLLVAEMTVLIGTSLALAAWGQQYGWIIWLYALVVPLALIVLWRVMAWRMHEYIITNRRIIQIAGVFNKDVLDSAIRQITDLHTNQTFFGRMFGFGDIEVLTASESGKNEIKMIADPLGFKRAMLDAQDNAALLHIAPNEAPVTAPPPR